VTTSTNIQELQTAVRNAQTMLREALNQGVIDDATYRSRLAQVTPVSEQGTDVVLTVRVTGDVSRLQGSSAGSVERAVQEALASTARSIGLTIQNVTVRV
jgi:hypothetical protein